MTDPAAPEAAAARSAFYSLLARALAVPDEQLHGAAGDGSLAGQIAQTAQGLPFPFDAPDWPPVPDFPEFQADFIAFFELGAKAPPCPLYEGAVRRDLGRKALMEELLRFYHHFGLGISEQSRELPDLLPVELEFMHYLAFLEARARQAAAEDDTIHSLVLAQRDFLSRHLAAWVPEVNQRAEKKTAPPFHRALLQALERFVAADLAFLRGRTA